jgi:hypothetical protein
MKEGLAPAEADITRTRDEVGRRDKRKRANAEVPPLFDGDLRRLLTCSGDISGESGAVEKLSKTTTTFPSWSAYKEYSNRPK